MTSTISTAFRTTLTETLRVYAGIADTDARIRRPAIIVRDDGSTNATTTVAITDSALVVVGNVSGTSTLTFSANATLTAMVAAVDAIGSGIGATLVAPDGAAASADLARLDATSIIGADLTLFLEDLKQVEQAAVAGFRFVEKWCCTNLIDGGEVVEQGWPQPGGTLLLANGRINRLNSVSVEGERAFDVLYNGAASRATIEVQGQAGGVPDSALATPAVVLRYQTFGNPETTTVIDADTETSVQDIVDSINAISGWVATLRVDGVAADLAPMPPRLVSSSRTQTVFQWTPADGDYRVDYAAGLLHLDSLSPFLTGTEVTAGQIRVRYRCGFRDSAGNPTMPEDLAHAVAVVGKALLDAGSRDAALASERLGDYAYTVSPSGRLAAAQAVEGLRPVLEPYRRSTP